MISSFWSVVPCLAVCLVAIFIKPAHQRQKGNERGRRMRSQRGKEGRRKIGSLSREYNPDRQIKMGTIHSEAHIRAKPTR